MKTRRIIFIGLGIIFCILHNGCQKPPNDQITKALASTNAVFQAIIGGKREVFQLSSGQTKKLKQIVKRFSDSSQVRIEKDILPASSGVFVLGDVAFGWVPNLIFLHDAENKRYFVVTDNTLDQMGKIYMASLGDKPPLHEPSLEQWFEILSAFEKAQKLK